MSEEQDFNFVCPNCQVELTGVPALIGKEVACPGCGHTITVPDPEAKAVEEKPAEADGILELRTKALPSTLRRPVKQQVVETEKEAAPQNLEDGDFSLKKGPVSRRRTAAPPAPPVRKMAPVEETPARPAADTAPKNSGTMKLPPVLPPKFLRNDPKFHQKKCCLIGILSFLGVFLLVVLLCLLFRGCGE